MASRDSDSDVQSDDPGGAGFVRAGHVRGILGDRVDAEKAAELLEARAKREGARYDDERKRRASERLKALKDPRVLQGLSLVALERMWYDASFKHPNNERGIQAIRDRKMLLFEVERLKWRVEELEARLASK